MTRAKSNLFVYLDTPSQIEPEEIEAWKNNSDKYNFYEANLKRACGVESLSELITGISQGEFTETGDREKVKDLELQEAGDYFQPNFPDPDKDFREIIAQKKDVDLNLQREVERMKGLAIHYYLENIKFAGEEEIKTARRLTASRFGNILGDELTERAIARAENFITENPRYFQEKWQIFNEYVPTSIGADSDEGARIDRLMVDREAQQILILDYKSGFSKKRDQLERYKNLIAEEVNADFAIEAEFAEV